MVEGKYEMVGGQVVNVKFLCQSTHKTGKYSEKFSSARTNLLINTKR